MTGKYVYWSILFTIATSLVWGGLLDLVLLRMDAKYSISDFLRAHPAWFWWPAALAVAGLVGLALHLYWLPAHQIPSPPPNTEVYKSPLKGSNGT